MKKEMRKITRMLVMAIALVMIGSIFAMPDDVSAATAYTAKRVTNVQVVKKTYNSVKLKWNKVSGTKYYQVYRSTSKNGKYKLIKTTKNNYFTNSKLTTGKYYYYKVRGYKTVNGTKKYTKYSYKIKTYPRLTTPTVKTSGSTTGVTVSWNKIAGADGYEIYRAVPGGSYTKVKTITAYTVKLYGAKCTDTSGEAGKTYNYKVRAYRKVNGNKKYSYFSSVKKNTKKLETPTLNTATPVGSTRSVILSWDSVPKATKYIVYRSTAGGSYIKIATTTSTTYTDTKRDYNTTYGYYIKAYRTVNNTTNYSANSSSKTATVKMDTTTVKVTSTDSTSVSLSWNQIQGAEGYKIYAKKGADGTYSTVKTISSGTTKTATITGLTGGTTYYFKVAGTATQYKDSSIVIGSASNVVSTTTALGTPVLKIATDDEAGTITLSWASISGAEKYIIYKSTDGGAYKTLGNMTTTSFGDPNVERGVEYTYKIKAAKAGDAGNIYSDESNVVSGTLNEIKDENALATPVVTAKADCTVPSITVTWDACENADGYEIYRAATDGEYGDAILVEGTSYEDTDVSIGDEYTYKVRAYRVVDEEYEYSEESAAITVTVTLAAPELTATVDAETPSITLTWTESAGAEKYIIYKSTDDGDYKTLGNVTTTSFTDTDVTTESVYNYKIKAAIGSGSDAIYSDLSNIVKGDFNATEEPGDEDTGDENTGGDDAGNTDDTEDEETTTVGNCTCTPSDRAISVAWDEVDGADYYEVWRATEYNGEYTCLETGLMTPSWYDNGLTPGQTYYYKIIVSGETEPSYIGYATVPALTHDVLNQHDWQPVLEEGVEYTTERITNLAVCENCYFSTAVDIYEHIDAVRGDDCGDFTTGQSFYIHKRVDTGEYVTTYTCECGATRVFELE